MPNIAYHPPGDTGGGRGLAAAVRHSRCSGGAARNGAQRPELRLLFGLGPSTCSRMRLALPYPACPSARPAWKAARPSHTRSSCSDLLAAGRLCAFLTPIARRMRK
jgi:hypothetical protein